MSLLLALYTAVRRARYREVEGYRITSQTNRPMILICKLKVRSGSCSTMRDACLRSYIHPRQNDLE